MLKGKNINDINGLSLPHKDCLCRFAFNCFEHMAMKTGCEVTIFCARLYGKRRSKRKTEQLIKELSDD